MSYQVMVAENGAYRENGYKHSEHLDLQSALTVCRTIVDDFLRAQHKPEGQSADELFRLYSTFGEDPYVIGPAPGEFSAWDYARQRCRELHSGD